MFPPRYAGMEGLTARTPCLTSGFPRATRGWKTVTDSTTEVVTVSPALRGDGRVSQRLKRR